MSNVMIRNMYVIHPDYVKSKSDGDVHFITADQLIRLYNVPRNLCIIYKDGYDRGFTEDYKQQLIHLYPRQDGNYSLELMG